jgi:hypothetical protein
MYYISRAVADATAAADSMAHEFNSLLLVCLLFYLFLALAYILYVCI